MTVCLPSLEHRVYPANLLMFSIKISILFNLLCFNHIFNVGYKVSVNPWPFVLFHKQQVQQFIHLAILHSICHPSPSPLLSFLHACIWLRTSLNCSLKIVFKLILAVSAQSMVAHTAHYCPVNSYTVLFRISLFSFLQLPSI